MSPEQGAGDPRIDGRGDVYALGCVVFEMLAGRAAVQGPDRAGHHRPPPA